MSSRSIRVRLAAMIGGAALLTMTSLVAACSKNENQAPPAPSPTSVSPTEKVISPTGGNKFSPTAVAPPAPTLSPGNHHHGLNGIS
ncbi:hypothetical protein B1R94_10370 [Mycolicibacterium litorale]|nr:hypothetical protein B1R94_10370 [Mycolicibacterium litorale]